jgi:hypothetical protein
MEKREEDSDRADQEKPELPFITYSDYLKFLENELSLGPWYSLIINDSFREPTLHDRDRKHTIHFRRFDKNGKCLQRISARRRGQLFDQRCWTPLGQTSTTEDIFRVKEAITSRDDNAYYQIIIVEVSIWDGESQLLEMMGLALDIEPRVWAYLLRGNRWTERSSTDGVAGPSYWQQELTICTDLPNVMEVEDHSFLILEAVPSKRPKTGQY